MPKQNKFGIAVDLSVRGESRRFFEANKIYDYNELANGLKLKGKYRVRLAKHLFNYTMNQMLLDEQGHIMDGNCRFMYEQLRDDDYEDIQFCIKYHKQHAKI
jgi:5-bromo-4-chloroindolyl phosphate hydrolysis protein